VVPVSGVVMRAPEQRRAAKSVGVVLLVVWLVFLALMLAGEAVEQPRRAH
jgi:hypothetical protein